MNTKSRESRGFSLAELLIVMAIIGILASIVYVNFSGTGGKGRDAKRQSDLKLLQNAIEEYKIKNGRYPAQGCGIAATSNNTPSFAIQGNCSDYVRGLVPEFLQRLPVDERAQSGQGFAYMTNTVGSVYKAMVIGTVESETVTYEHPLSSCDTSIVNRPADASGGPLTRVMCRHVVHSSHGTPGQCEENNSRFQTSYAVWGGYAEPTSNWFNGIGSTLDLTQRVICR